MARNKHQAPKATAEETVVAQDETVNQEPNDAGNESNDAVEESGAEQTAEGGTESTEPTAEGEGPVAPEEEVAQETTAESSAVNAEVEPAPQVTVDTAADAEVVKYDEYAGTSVITRTFMDIVDKHIAILDPKRPVNAEAGINSQRAFANALVNIFKLKDVKDFVATMDLLIKKIKDNGDGAFNEKHAFRHWGQLPMAKDRLKAFEYNLSALLTLAKTADRKAAYTSVDFKLAFANVDDASITRLQAYFKRMCGI